jgi:hypothetical protein
MNFATNACFSASDMGAVYFIPPIGRWFRVARPSGQVFFLEQRCPFNFLRVSNIDHCGGGGW